MKGNLNITDIIKEATKRFSKYLEENNNRKTHERFAILEEIYLNQKHFDAETLYVQMKKSAYRVSRATIYNTLDVLLACNLIKRHNFGENVSFFERKYGFPIHHHMICTNCKSITEFEDHQIQQIARNNTSRLSFQINDISLNLYGLCQHCNKT